MQGSFGSLLQGGKNEKAESISKNNGLGYGY